MKHEGVRNGDNHGQAIARGHLVEELGGVLGRLRVEIQPVELRPRPPQHVPRAGPINRVALEARPINN